jgi:hypothetical protein
MAVTAILSTNLQESDLIEGSLSPELAEYHDNHRHRLRISLTGGQIYGDPRTCRSSSIDMESGELIVGNIQDEDPLAKKLVFGKLERDMPQVEGGRVSLYRKSVLFEIERLFGGKLTTLELSDYLADGEKTIEHAMEEQSQEVREFFEKYKIARAKSVLGLPVIESDFRVRKGYARDLDNAKLYGPELYKLLIENRQEIFDATLG